jgi:hypothetical protein
MLAFTDINTSTPCKDSPPVEQKVFRAVYGISFSVAMVMGAIVGVVNIDGVKSGAD